MARGKPLTVEQIELAKATYATTRSYREAGRAAGCSANAAKVHIDADDGFEQVRAEKRVGIIGKIAELQLKLIDAMMSDAHINKASMLELGTVFGIATDKRQLMTGEATERHEHRTADEDREHFARRLDELAERRRARGAADGVRTG